MLIEVCRALTKDDCEVMRDRAVPNAEAEAVTFEIALSTCFWKAFSVRLVRRGVAQGLDVQVEDGLARSSSSTCNGTTGIRVFADRGGVGSVEVTAGHTRQTSNRVFVVLDVVVEALCYW